MPNNKSEDAFMTITIKVKKNGNIRLISAGAGGEDKDEKPAKVEDGPPDQNLLELDDPKVMGGSNPCIWFNINGRMKKVCW
jgi:hypothetical protein